MVANSRHAGRSPTARYDVFDAACPTRTVLASIADKWATLVIELLGLGPQRFGALRRSVGGISQKMLTETLRKLERDGLVRRRVYPTRPPRVEYALTPLGRTLLGPIVAIREWAEANIEQVLAARAEYDAREVSDPAEPLVEAAEA
jgi:DNA-binding HxlR family transcriptional regulator